MTQQYSALVIEDKNAQYRMVSDDLESGGWQLRRAIDEAGTLRELEQSSVIGPRFDAVAIDLGLPPDIDNPLRVGVPLAETIRRLYPSLPVLAYSSISPTSGGAHYDLLLSRFLPLGVSFVYLRRLPDDVPLCVLLEQVRLGFHILGPGPADFLPKVAATAPDPLDKKLWDTLEALSRGLTDRQIAEYLNDVGEHGSRHRIDQIRLALVSAGFFSHDQRVERRELVTWYREHRVRYRRP
jgi:CheY-like chemotaxis protein